MVAKGVVSCWVGVLVVWNSAGADENIRHEMIAVHTALDGLRVTMSTSDEHIRSSVDTHCWNVSMIYAITTECIGFDLPSNSGTRSSAAGGLSTSVVAPSSS
jgi:hypothetical protein